MDRHQLQIDPENRIIDPEISIIDFEISKIVSETPGPATQIQTTKNTKR